MPERPTIEWRLAYSHLLAFEQNLPGLIDEECVHHYHLILDELQSAAELELNQFRIEPTQLAYQTARRAASSSDLNDTISQESRRGTDRRYCDREYFLWKIEKLKDFLAP